MTKSDPKAEKIEHFIASRTAENHNGIKNDVLIIDVKYHPHNKPLTYLVAGHFCFPTHGDDIILDGVKCCVQSGCCEIDYVNRTLRVLALVMQRPDFEEMKAKHPTRLVEIVL